MGTSRWIAALGVTAIWALAVPADAAPRILAKRSEEAQRQILSCIERGAWIAYFQDRKGRLAPVRDTMNTENDQDWLGLRFARWEGPRIRLGVLKVLNKSAEAEENGGSGKIAVPVAGIQELLTSALYSTRRFDVIEQKRVEEILKQQTRKDTAEPSPRAIREIGQVLGVQYLVYGTVNEWSPHRRRTDLGPGKSFQAGKNEAEVAITFSLTDISTGQVIFTTAERARSGEWSFGFTHPEAGKGAVTQNTPINYALQACVNKAAYKIATFLRHRKWIGAVAKIEGVDVYINAGDQQGMTPETLLLVQSLHGLITDPESGIILGEHLRGIGNLKVFTVRPGFSLARAAEPAQQKELIQKIKVGYRVELASPPVPPSSIPECKALDPSQEL